MDCSQHAEPLQYGKTVHMDEAGFEYQYYELPSISPAMLTHSVEVRFSVSYFSSNYGKWASAKPELLLLKVWSPYAVILLNSTSEWVRAPGVTSDYTGLCALRGLARHHYGGNLKASTTSFGVGHCSSLSLIAMWK